MLVRWGLDRIQEEAVALASDPLPAALLSSPVAQGLYAKLGFKVLAFDGRRLGLKEENAVMIWDPLERWTRSLPDNIQICKNERMMEVVLRRSEVEEAVIELEHKWEMMKLAEGVPVPSPETQDALVAEASEKLP